MYSPAICRISPCPILPHPSAAAGVWLAAAPSAQLQRRVAAVSQGRQGGSWLAGTGTLAAASVDSAGCRCMRPSAAHPVPVRLPAPRRLRAASGAKAAGWSNKVAGAREQAQRLCTSAHHTPFLGCASTISTVLALPAPQITPSPPSPSTHPPTHHTVEAYVVNVRDACAPGAKGLLQVRLRVLGLRCAGRSRPTACRTRTQADARHPHLHPAVPLCPARSR